MVRRTRAAPRNASPTAISTTAAWLRGRLELVPVRGSARVTCTPFTVTEVLGSAWVTTVPNTVSVVVVPSVVVVVGAVVVVVVGAVVDVVLLVVVELDVVDDEVLLDDELLLDEDELLLLEDEVVVPLPTQVWLSWKSSSVALGVTCAAASRRVPAVAVNT